ncbi:6-bladed beta-propeller [Draconibacterium sediminis]|uniref:6-bladed beta-propeller n=1 Tax=Draconibacterium sediminis TaxID=1544798 RepID=A0A0D8JG39_9BACT|nr:6-bladed beta-propeller [Draconibacterium sediminis]KJF45689.1 hypothetical protein LH29_10220 [Draconibacterium sediminis]
MIKKRLPLIISLIDVLIIWGCSQQPKSNIVTLQPTTSDELYLGTPTEIVQLETTEESSLDYIYKTFIDDENDKIFVLANFNVYTFSRKGKFQSKLKQGNGPGEINMIVAFCADAKNKRFYALDMGNTLHIFNYDGEIIETQKITAFPSFDIYPKDEENVFLYCNYVGRNEKFFVGIYNLQRKEITQKFISEEESPYAILTMGNANNFQKIGDRLFFSSPNIFGLFEAKADTFRRNITYDLGPKSVPENFYSPYVNERKRARFGQACRENGYVPYLLASFYYNQHYISILDDEKGSCFVIDEKDRSKIYMNGQLSDYFNLPKLESLQLPTGIQEKQITFACSPLEFFDDDIQEETKLISIADLNIEIRYDQNPFLIIATD